MAGRVWNPVGEIVALHCGGALALTNSFGECSRGRDAQLRLGLQVIRSIVHVLASCMSMQVLRSASARNIACFGAPWFGFDGRNQPAWRESLPVWLTSSSRVFWGQIGG
ncbi:hypothetical protein BJX62DRAFT_220225, partial [Aspergillus germanicus]